MRRKIVAGNWKMNLHAEEAELLVRMVVDGISTAWQADVIFFPPFPYISMIAELLDEDQGVFVGAQNCSYKTAGAFTGEVSAPMLFDCGASHVIIGHSERRVLFNEQAKTLAEKLRVAHESGLIPVWCCGEQKEDRLGSKQFDIVKKQIDNELNDLSYDALSQTIIAYEPVWAIGTGLTASAQEAQEMHAFIRSYLNEQFQGVGSEVSILYGGSCNESNAATLFACPDIDGGLIGGASLSAEKFLKIIGSF